MPALVDSRELPIEALDLPDDLQLPTPAQPFKRIVAGAIDALVSSAVGATVWASLFFTLRIPEVAEAAGIVAASTAWVVRDCIIDEGNRSIGKKLQGLEVAFWDGTLPHRSDCLKRNVYWAAFPFLYFHPLCNQASTCRPGCVCVSWTCKTGASLFMTSSAFRTASGAFIAVALGI